MNDGLHLKELVSLCSCRVYFWHSSTTKMMDLFILLCRVGCYCVIGGVNVGCGSGTQLVVHWAKFFKKLGFYPPHTSS